MFSAFFAGAFLLVTGTIGYDVSRLSGPFRGGRWVDGPVWWQILLGVGFLLLATFLSRRLGGPGWRFVRRPPQRRIVKYVGRGSTYESIRRREED